ncbi:MAG: stage 0 sporulation family protein [Clostridia bacterium]|nr:stage 0 sporulation family protein [Clostridia bacterium]
MASVIGVRFKNAGKLYYFDPGVYWPTAGDAVLVETVRGIEYGEVVTGVKEVSDDLITPPLKKVIRIATAEDAQHDAENRAREKEAMAICQKKVQEHKLQMKLVGCEYTFDNSKILFYFTSDKRVDFRALVKDLATAFHTRIELRQIGVRDEAKMMGGLGMCGRPVCCAQFLGDFQPVSIKMAKEQNLSLNPTKISGICGRLMCCLKYEEDHYEATRKRMPKVGKEVITPDGTGTVIDLNILKETVRVRIPKGDGAEQKDYPLEDVQRVPPGRSVKKQRPEETEEETAASEDMDTPDEESLEEFAQEEGLTPDEALAEIEEITEEDLSEDIIEVDSEDETAENNEQ